MTSQSTSTNDSDVPPSESSPETQSCDAQSQSAIDQALAGDVENQSVDHRVAEAERRVLMAQAEMENFRKRMQRESDQALKYANLPLVRDLLDVIDNLKRATDSAKVDVEGSEASKALLSGVELVSQQFSSVLAKYGCQPIEAAGVPFDPNVHQAISQAVSDQPAGYVAQEVAVGYRLHDRVVRPSCVIVSTGNGS